jgi:hypothetical protein
MRTLRCTLATATAEPGIDQKERQLLYNYMYSDTGDRVMQGDGESHPYRKSVRWRPADPLHNFFPRF